MGQIVNFKINLYIFILFLLLNISWIFCFCYFYVWVLLVVSYEDKFHVGFFSILIQQRKSYIVEMNNKKVSIHNWSFLAYGKIESDDECG